MSMEVMNWVWRNSRMRGTGLLVMMCIADRAHDDGTGTHYSVKTISEKARCSNRQVTRLLREAEGLGELIVRRNQGPRGAHRYEVLMQQTLPGIEVDPAKMSSMTNLQPDADVIQSHSSPTTIPPLIPPWLKGLYEAGVLGGSMDKHRDQLLIDWASRERLSDDLLQRVADNLCQAWPGIKGKKDPRKRYMNWCRIDKESGHARVRAGRQHPAKGLPGSEDFENYSTQA